MTVPDLVAAIKAELCDMLDAMRDANGNLFSPAAKRALAHSERVDELLGEVERQHTRSVKVMARTLARVDAALEGIPE
jgi:hypothetical protein